MVCFIVVFGVHENCKDYYCNISKTSADGSEKKEENLVESLKKTAEVWALIYAANEKIALNAGRLSNESTNVKNFMSVINKFNCGKLFSLGRRGTRDVFMWQDYRLLLDTNGMKLHGKNKPPRAQGHI